MNSFEIKTYLHQYIEWTDDPNLLRDLMTRFESKFPEKPIELAPWQLLRIEESKQQIENGQCYSQEEIEQMAEEWLKE